MFRREKSKEILELFKSLDEVYYELSLSNIAQNESISHLVHHHCEPFAYSNALVTDKNIHKSALESYIKSLITKANEILQSNNAETKIDTENDDIFGDIDPNALVVDEINIDRPINLSYCDETSFKMIIDQFNQLSDDILKNITCSLTISLQQQQYLHSMKKQNKLLDNLLLIHQVKFLFFFLSLYFKWCQTMFYTCKCVLFI